MSNDQNGKVKDPKEDPTRRQWLLKLGEIVALVGFRGIVGEAIAKPTPLFALPDSSLAALPPGLYEASNDHLTHALTSDDLFHPIPPGSETDYARPRGEPFQPQFFSRPEFQVVRRIAELMLGEPPKPSEVSDVKQGGQGSVVDEVAEWIDFTVFNAAKLRNAALNLAPEHRILAVHYYGASAVVEMETSDPQKVWREGLAWLAQESDRRFHHPFPSLNEEQQIEILKLLSDDRPDKTDEYAGSRFFQLIKSEVIRGFYTSRVGLRELDYKGNSFYPESPACPGEAH